MRVLIVSNLDSREPFGQFLRPFHLGRGLARAGVDVASVGVDCSAVDFGPSWSTRAKFLRAYAGAARQAARSFRPDVVYGHEARGGAAAILAGVGAPVVVDYHALPSVEWAGYARTAGGAQGARLMLNAARSGAAEQLMARRGAAIIAAGQEVAEDLRRLHRPRVEPVVIPNGVSDDMLEHGRSGPSPYAQDGVASAMTTIPGAQSEANARALEFLREVAGRLEAGGGGVRLHVIGSADGPAAPGLRYEGFQDVLADWVAHADVCLLPYPASAALAGGPRNKLLEALAIGRTLVTTREGVRGLREVADWPGVTVAPDDPAAFAAAIRAAAAPDAATLDEARPRVRERLRWDALAARVRDVLAGVADARS